MGPKPLSDMQQSMLAHEALADRPIYTMPVGVRISGPLDTDALQHALHHVVRRHPVLYARYAEGTALVPATADAPAVHRISGPLPCDEDDPRLTGFYDAPFDLAEESPLRAQLISDGSHDHHLALAVHHVAGDSWSLALVLRELGAAYVALTRGHTPQIGPAAPDFFDYAAGEGQGLLDTEWWHKRLHDVEPRPYPKGSPPSDSDRGTFLSTDLRLDATRTRGIRQLARSARVSPSVVLLAAVSTAVSTADHGHEATIGLPTALRDTTERQATVGPLLNNLPIRTTWSPQATGQQILTAHAEAVEEALGRKDVPYSSILKAAAIRRTTAAPPLFLHVVNVDTEIPRLRLPSMRATTLAVAPRWATFPALWEFGWGAVGNIHGTLRVSADGFTAEHALDLAEEFHTTLARLTEDRHELG